MTHRFRPLRLAAPLALTLLGLTPALAQGAISDASCPGPPNGNVGVGPDQRYAQTFTEQHTGTPATASLTISKSAGGDFVIQVVQTGAGAPLNVPAAASATVADASIPNGVQTAIQASFAGGTRLVSGQQYALTIQRNGTAAWNIFDHTGDICPGSEFLSNGPTNPWLVQLGYDMPFQTSVTPANDLTLKSQQGRTLLMSVLNAGVVSIAGSPTKVKKSASAAKKTVLLAPTQATASGPGDVSVPIALSKAGKSRLKAGKVKSGATVTFTPTGGQANVVTTIVTIKGKKKG